MSKTFFVGLFGGSQLSRLFKASSQSDDPPYPEGPSYSIYSHYRRVNVLATKPEYKPVCKPVYRPVDRPVYPANPYPRGFEPRPSRPTTSTSPCYQVIRPRQQPPLRDIPEIRPQQATACRPYYTAANPQQQPPLYAVPEIRPKQQRLPSHCYYEVKPMQPPRIIREIRPQGYNFGDNWNRARPIY